MISTETRRAFFHFFPPFLGLILFVVFCGRLIIISAQTERNIIRLQNRWENTILQNGLQGCLFSSFRQVWQPEPGEQPENPINFLKEQQIAGPLINKDWQQHVESFSRDWQQLLDKLSLLETHCRAFQSSPAGRRLVEMMNGQGKPPTAPENRTGIPTTSGIERLQEIRQIMNQLNGLKEQSTSRMELFLHENSSRLNTIRYLILVSVIISSIYFIFYGVSHSERRVKWYARLHEQLEAANRELQQKNAALLQEIEERKKAEFRLQESEQRTRLVVETSTNGLGMVDAQDRVLYINPSLQRMFGYSLDEIRGLNFESLIPEALRPRIRQQIMDVYNGSRDYFEIALPDKSGRPRDVLISPRSTFDENGVEPGAFAIFTDISLIKQTGKQLQESKQMLERVINTIPQFIFWMNPELRFEGCNLNFAKASGFSRPDDLVGKTVQDLPWNPAETELVCAENRQVLSSGQAIHHSVQKLTAADGATIWIDVNRVPLFDENGTVSGVLVAFEDVTRKLKAEKAEQEREQALIQADKMISLGILVAGVAHEMNNPNQFIISHVEPLRRAWEGAIPILDKYHSEHGEFRMGGVNYSRLKERMPAIFQNILEGTRRISKIVNELKEFSREKPAQNLEAIQINSVVQSSLTLISNMINQSTNHFSTRYGQDLPLINGHYQQLEQVLINLVQNACQALTSKEERISITTRLDKRNSTIVVEISDEGRGIEPDLVKHMADPFFTTKQNSGGIGLGLSISSNIVLNHGGKLEFQPGKKRGMIATMSLPADLANDYSSE